MAKCIYICTKKSSTDHHKERERKLTSICNHLQPDNLSEAHHEIQSVHDASFGIMNHKPSIQIKNGNVLLGFIYDDAEDWHKPGAQAPDGNFAIFRNNEHEFEAVSDILATRTIWYYHDEEVFIASTSQRAIIMYLGSFEFNERVIPWVLSTGTPGPDYSWDQRIKKLPPDSSVHLDKKEWSINTTVHPFRFHIQKKSYKEHQKKLYDVMSESIKALTKLDSNHWPLTLSGGYDSRAILYFLKMHHDGKNPIRTITHGTEESRSNKISDAYIADLLAKEENTDHTFYSTDLPDESIETVFDRYLNSSEGRVDHITGYLDGMKMWKDFVEKEEIQGVIRGDVVFHPFKVPTERFVRHRLGFQQCSDFSNLDKISKKFGLADQEVPERLQIKEDESPYDWRERVYQGFRVPTVHGALTEIKLTYVELVSPFLSRKMIKTMRGFPQKIRINKDIFKNIVDDLSPDIPYAKEEATISKARVLREPEIAEYLKKKLSSDFARNLLGSEFMDYIVQRIKSKEEKEYRESLILKLKKTFQVFVYDNFPDFIMYYYEKFRDNPRLDDNVLAFRVFMIVRMNEILKEDSRTIEDQ